MTQRVSPSMESEIVAALRSGTARERVAGRFGLDVRTIRRIAGDYGLAGRCGPRSTDPDLLPGTRAVTVEERRERRRISDRLYRDRRASVSTQLVRPDRACQQAGPVRDLAEGRTAWRCDQCGAVQCGATCRRGHGAPWLPLTQPLSGAR